MALVDQEYIEDDDLNDFSDKGVNLVELKSSPPYKCKIFKHSMKRYVSFIKNKK